MYVNDRDQINYHGFLRSARERNGANQPQVAKGIYTHTSYNRAEMGVRVPEKLVRDRLTSRIGFSGERYVEYVCIVELQQWKLRQTIVKALAHKDVQVAEAALAELAEIFDKDNTVQLQFMKSMRFFLLQLKGASKEELCATVKEAVDCTVPNIDKALVGKHLLAEQELNLIAEYMRLKDFSGNPSNENTWRILEYQKIISYINGSFMENLLKVKVYPKVTHFICEELLKEETPLHKLRDALKLCDKSLELLLDTHRLYYFMEILEYRKEILYRMLNCDLDDFEKKELNASLVENAKMEEEWKARYEAAGVSPYMDNSSYLYWETECCSAVETLEARRKMLRIPRATLREDICTERSLIRIERTNLSPSMFALNNLFERMGLCAEYRRGQIVSFNTYCLDIYKKLVEAMNSSRMETCETHIAELKDGLCMHISFNQQEVKRIENLCAYRKGELSMEELYEQAIDALECTLPIWALHNHKNNSMTYFTRSELACIYDVAFMVKGPDTERSIEVLKDYCSQNMKEGIHPAHLGVMEFLLNGLSAHLSANGEEDKAKALQKELVKTCLFYKRMPFSVTNPGEINLMWIE